MKTLNKRTARHVLKVVDAGLSSGLGHPKPGEMCVEAAVCYALGLPHGDDPKCVGGAVRSIKIALNDSNWSSNAARAKGMRKIAIAQLGSNTIDQHDFTKLVALKVVQKVVPAALRAAASMKGNQLHAERLILAALNCEKAEGLDAASDAASDAARAARYAARAASDAASEASYAASYAASEASYAARAAREASYAASYAARAARYAASYAARAARYAASEASYAARDKMLTLLAACILEALIELKSPGCKWLNICDE